MVKQVGKSSLMAKLGDRGRRAHEAHKSDETTYGMINLPPGINGGIAQLEMAQWGTYKEGTKNAGQPYVILRGIAVSPEDHNGQPVKGLGVSLTLPLCDTPDRKKNQQPKMFDDNYADMLNELRKLGVDTDGFTFDDIEGVLATLEESQPYYRFSTRGWTPPANPKNPKPTEMTIVQFDGVVTDFSDNGTPGGRTVDQSGEPTGEGGVEDVTALGAAAVAGDTNAQARLNTLAAENGISDEQINEASDWDAVAELIIAAAGGTTPEPEPEPEPEPSAEPDVGEVWKYQAPDPRTRKPAIHPKTKKPVLVNVEVKAINKRTKTCDLLNLENNKTVYKGVKLDELVPA